MTKTEPAIETTDVAVSAGVYPIVVDIDDDKQRAVLLRAGSVEIKPWGPGRLLLWARVE